MFQQFLTASFLLTQTLGLDSDFSAFSPVCFSPHFIVRVMVLTHAEDPCLALIGGQCDCVVCGSGLLQVLILGSACVAALCFMVL